MAAPLCPDVQILITNDDGIASPGLRLLYEAVQEVGKPIVIAPRTPRSAYGHGMTLHTRIKATRLILWGKVHALAIDGLPSDAVYIALSNNRPDIVLSGINIGDNTSLQSILASSTIGAIVHATLNGVPGIAFSMEIESEDEFSNVDKRYLEFIKAFIKKLVRGIVYNGLLGPIGALSVNFPRRLSNKEIFIARPAALRYRQRAEQVEARGDTTYYRLVGYPVTPPPGSDVDLLLKGHIVITPLCLEYIGSCAKTTFYQAVKLLSGALGLPVKFN